LCFAIDAITSVTAGRSAPPFERRHPDHFAESACCRCHVLDGGRVDAADGEVQVDAAEHVDPRHLLTDDVGEPRRELVVVLDDDGPHAVRLGLPRGFDGIDGPRAAVRLGMDVNVDSPAKRIRCSRVLPSPTRDTGDTDGGAQCDEQHDQLAHDVLLLRNNRRGAAARTLRVRDTTNLVDPVAGFKRGLPSSGLRQ
jgi:hypothetical protein